MAKITTYLRTLTPSGILLLIGYAALAFAVLIGGPLLLSPFTFVAGLYVFGIFGTTALCYFVAALVSIGAER